MDNEVFTNAFMTDRIETVTQLARDLEVVAAERPNAVDARLLLRTVVQAVGTLVHIYIQPTIPNQ